MLEHKWTPNYYFSVPLKKPFVDFLTFDLLLNTNACKQSIFGQTTPLVLIEFLKMGIKLVYSSFRF